MRRKNSKYLLAIVSVLANFLGAFAYAATPVPVPPRAPLASDFPGPLWEIVAPAGGTASSSNLHLFLNVPGGSNHGLLPSNQAVRVVQPVGDNNFDVSIKIDSPVLATNVGSSQGLMVIAGQENFATFALVSADGTHIGLRVQTITGGVAATVLDEADFSQYQTPICLRLTRTGSVYTAYYSVDEVTWVPAIDFTDPMIPIFIGPFAANDSTTSAKAFPVAMSVNWFKVQ
jgi:hypothetical protein